MDHEDKKKSFLMLALDHRGSFSQTAGTSDTNTLIDIKESIIASTYNDCSGLLLDQDFGIPAYKRYCAEHHIEQPKPFITCIEETGYENQDEEKITTLQYKVSSLKEIGAQGIKLLLFFNPDGKYVQKQINTAQSVMSDCQKEGLPFFLEIVTYPIPSHPYEKGTSITRSLELLQSAGVHPTVWKLEYPGSKEECSSINTIVSSTPWILLTRGVTFDIFCEQLSTAVSEGCTGFLAGRAIWQEFPHMKTNEQKEEFFSKIVPERFKKICNIVQT